MKQAVAHIINHTHWDREWFLTSVYTGRWIPGLIDRLAGLVEQNPAFHFYLDGQTLVIEDLLQLDPGYHEKIARLIKNGNLHIGPYYCQPDWRLTGGEALLRNLLYGRQDMRQYGAITDTGWLVDTFGHISQAPQLHHLSGIKNLYVWRGAPQLTPYFEWRGADGTSLFAINLFGGYRNLYSVTHAPEVALKRLLNEIDKLTPYYPTADIPLFDGYDLEDDPEDPVRFYQDRREAMPPEILIREATPDSFAEEMRRKLPEIPVISGELNSGKYGAVFPGSLSTRTYLKVMAQDCERLLYRVCEPLGTLAWLKGRPYPGRQYQAWSRVLLQNAVHDCICGVSIDQVHEKMEFSYRQAFEKMQADVHGSLAHILADFAPGKYAVSTNPTPYEGWHTVGDGLWRVQTHGIGVWKAGQVIPIANKREAVETFEWKNRYYEARVHPDGRVQAGAALLGTLLVYAERGDAYSGETGRLLGALKPNGKLILEQESKYHSVVRIPCSGAWDRVRVSALLRLTFDASPLIRWQIELDSRGTDFRVEMQFETARRGHIYAGMPFDVVGRASSDRDLLPRNLEARLESVLLGQRELGEVKTFPFHDFVAVSDGSASAVVFARGLHAYQADESGQIRITLRRAFEWLARPGLQYRAGDAGPFFYVPDARCERSVTHELAAAFLEGGVDDGEMHALNSGYQNPPLLVESQSAGTREAWPYFQESLPISSMHVENGRILARLFNPTARPQRLSQAYLQTGVAGNPESPVAVVAPKKILTIEIGAAHAGAVRKPAGPVVLSNAPEWRVGENQGLPDPGVIQGLRDKIKQLEEEVEEAAAQVHRASPPGAYRLQRQVYVLKRELLEYRLSLRLNEIKLAMQGRITRDYLYEPDEDIAALGRELNQLRIKRRIYDYIVQAT